MNNPISIDDFHDWVGMYLPKGTRLMNKDFRVMEQLLNIGLKKEKL